MAKQFSASGIEHPRLRALLRDPQRIGEAERVLTACGCRALPEALASQLIRNADVSVWHIQGVQLKEVTIVLRLGNASDEPAVHRFLDQVITNGWLTVQYRILPPQFLAGALHALWVHTPRYVCDHFLAIFPTPRVEACMRFLHKTDVPFPAIPNLELLGASSLFEQDVFATTRAWPTQDKIDEIVEHFSIDLGERSLNSHQILFLTGLREIVRRHPDLIRYSPESGERVLTLLKATVTTIANHQRLNAWLLDWLERCSKLRWLLIKDNDPIPTPLAPQSTELGNSEA